MDDDEDAMSIAYAILGTLIGQRLHPYAVCSAVNERIGRFWPISPGQLYASLQRLERRALLGANDGGGDRPRTYTTTPAGIRAFDAWLTRVAPGGRGDGPGYDDWIAHVAVCAHLGEDALLDRAIEVHRQRCCLLERGLANGETPAERTARELIHAELDWLELVKTAFRGPLATGEDEEDGEGSDAR